MKLKLQTIITCLLLLISFTAKSQGVITGYNDNDVQKLQNFFAQTDGTTTNGVKMNSGYNSTDVNTWTSVTWDSSNPKRVLTINFNDKNMFGSFNCSGFTALTDLRCNNNQLTTLDVSNNTTLNTLYCSNNKLNGLDFSTNISLNYLYCKNNQLTTLNVSANTALTILDCSYNKLPILDVSNNKSLTDLNCYYNQLTALNVSANTALTYLNCYNNQLPILDVSNNKSLTYLNCAYNQLPALNVSANIALTSLNCYDNKLPILDVNANTKLTYLNCGYNQLTTLNISKNTDLTNFYCNHNKLAILDLSKNTALTDFDCSDNKLTTLDVSTNNALLYFKCDNNQITGLNVSTNTALINFTCRNNQLSTLNLSKNTTLNNLDCAANKLKFSDIQYASTATGITDSPQRPFIPIGVDTIGGTMAAAIGGTINLTAETNVGPIIGGTDGVTKFHVWKKAWNGAITEVTAQCTFNGGSIKLPPTAGEFDSLFITMSNPTYPDFVEQTTPVTYLATAMRTRTFAFVGAAFLPIELLSFTANLNNNKVDLAWSTASEKNNAFFTVERSINNQNWENVVKVDGAGNSNTQLNYSTIDANPLSGVSYYRLKQTDFDGKFEYSKTVVIDRNIKTTIQLYPNPATNEISVTGNEDDLNSVKIYNSLGQNVTKYTNYSASNTKQITIDISKLTTGIYILKTKNTTNRLIVK